MLFGCDCVTLFVFEVFVCPLGFEILCGFGDCLKASVL